MVVVPHTVGLQNPEVCLRCDNESFLLFSIDFSDARLFYEG